MDQVLPVTRTCDVPRPSRLPFRLEVRSLARDSQLCKYWLLLVEMSSATDNVRFRTFTASKVHRGAPLALGRNHSSWFLVFARPHGVSMTRATMCLNFIDPTDPSTIGGIMPGTNKRRFTVGGTMGEDVLDTLLALRDKEDNKLVAVVQRYPSDHPRR